MQNHSYENDFDLHENETACRTHFRMKGFALILKQRHERTRKWPIFSSFVYDTIYLTVCSKYKKMPDIDHFSQLKIITAYSYM